jgi:hypothetical protein
MRKGLGSVRARVERLAAQLAVGCPVCRQDVGRIRFHWVNDRSRLEGEIANLPQTKTCEGCGDTYPLTYTAIGWLH